MNKDIMDIEENRRLAEQGNPEAQFILAVIYYLGKGVDADREEALRWALRSAEQGYCKAQYMVAKMYSGEGDEVDWTKAAYWYGKAAGNGDVISMHQLANCYREGNGVKQDFKKAREFYTLAAERGNTESVCGLQLLDWMLIRDRQSQENMKKELTYEEYLESRKAKPAERKAPVYKPHGIWSDGRRKTGGRSGFARRADALSQNKLIIKVCLILLGIDVIVLAISLAVGNYEGCVVSFVTLGVLLCMLVYYTISYYEKKK